MMFVRTRPALHEAETGCYEAEIFGLEAVLASRTGLNIPDTCCLKHSRSSQLDSCTLPDQF